MSELRTSSELVPSARMEGESLVVRVRGEVDLHNSPSLRTEIFDQLAKQNAKHVVLNLGDVPYMDSSAIAVLVETLQRIRKRGGKVSLTNVQPRVQGILDIARLGSIFNVVATEEEAVA